VGKDRLRGALAIDLASGRVVLGEHSLGEERTSRGSFQKSGLASSSGKRTIGFHKAARLERCGRRGRFLDAVRHRRREGPLGKAPSPDRREQAVEDRSHSFRHKTFRQTQGRAWGGGGRKSQTKRKGPANRLGERGDPPFQPGRSIANLGASIFEEKGGSWARRASPGRRTPPLPVEILS